MKRLLGSVAALALLTMQVHPAFADSSGSATGGTAATQSTLSGCINQAPSLSTGQQAGQTCDANGNLNVNVKVGGAVTIGTTFSPAQVTLNNASATQILGTSATPAGRSICNIDAAIVEYIGGAAVTTANGIPLQPSGCWDASHTSAAIYGIAASGTPKAAGVQY